MMVSSFLEVTEPASDRSLLSLAEMRFAVGAKGTKSDANLKIVESRVAARLAEACYLKTGGAVPATFRLETITETFVYQDDFYGDGWAGSYSGEHWPGNLSGRNPRYQIGEESLQLARKPIISVSSIVQDDGTPFDPTAYRVVSSQGRLLHKRPIGSNTSGWWFKENMVIVYKAGWSVVPDTLKRAAEELLRLYWFANPNHNVRSVEIPGVRVIQYQIGAVSEPEIPQGILDSLYDFRNVL